MLVICHSTQNKKQKKSFIHMQRNEEQKQRKNHEKVIQFTKKFETKSISIFVAFSVLSNGRRHHQREINF